MARFALGCIKDSYDRRDYAMSTFLKAAPLAERVDHASSLPPIFDQGPAGTCVACASAYYNKSFQEGLEHRWNLNDPQHQFSPLYIYSQRLAQPADEGMTIREAMKILKEQGVCSLSSMPYDPQRINEAPTAEQRKAAAPYCAKSYARLTTITEMEAYLMTNCFIAGVMVHERFMDAPGGIIPMPEPGCEFLGGHAICIMGFDRRNRMFKFANSWATQWGDRGFGHIGYATLQALLMDAWGMVDAVDGAPTP
jgi:C1A family cysteine protease